MSLASKFEEYVHVSELENTVPQSTPGARMVCVANGMQTMSRTTAPATASIDMSRREVMFTMRPGGVDEF